MAEIVALKSEGPIVVRTSEIRLLQLDNDPGGRLALQQLYKNLRQEDLFRQI